MSNIKVEKIGIAVVGMGVGEEHARALMSSKLCDLKWVYDLDSDKARAVAGKVGAGAIAKNFEDILEDPNVTAVVIASYDDAHFRQVMGAFKAGKHVFVEKPLCYTLDELLAVKEAWAKHEGKLKLSSNLVLRAAPLYRWLKEEIEEGVLGEIYAFDGDYLYGRIHKITEGWRGKVEDYSVMLGGGIHLVDLMFWLTDQRPSSVWCAGNAIATKGTSFRYKDYVAAVLHFKSGMIGRITANFGCVHRHQHVIRVFGTKGTFIYDDSGSRWHGSANPDASPRVIDLPALPSSKGDLIEGFLSAIIHDEDLRPHTQNIFDVVSACIACDESLKQGREVEVQYL